MNNPLKNAQMGDRTTLQFSFLNRKKNIERFDAEEFDLLIVGGGITGAGVAWDAVSRGLKVALVEKDDFAQGTSSRSSKLIHGGLRYLENQEFGLVFEALSERAYLLENCPHLVRPLPFFMPIYQGDAHPGWMISAGMWLYDVLAMFRAPGLHQKLSSGAVARHIPFLKQEKLECAFKYFDASMWDDALVLDVLAKAHEKGAAIVSRCQAVESKKNSAGRIVQMKVRDQLGNKEHWIRFKKLVVCAGVWTDEVGKMMDSSNWKNWLAPSRGLHLVFDWKRIPVPGAVVMQHPEDGRISFVIPRKDYGQGVTLVGTTDGPCTLGPDQIENEAAGIAQDKNYLMKLLNTYFPDLKLNDDDVVSHYIGIRPLVDPKRANAQSGSTSNQSSLQQVSREHTIDHGPGESVIVAGGKYTTFRKMAEEIVDFAMHGEADWKDQQRNRLSDEPIFEPAMPSLILAARERARGMGYVIPEKLYERYGADALEIAKINEVSCQTNPHLPDPEGFPWLEAQFRYAVRHQMVLSVEDFVRRRQPLYLCRADQGAPWFPMLEKALADELNSR
jgi:glycerol-3-phosphate dehydrogenase